MTNCCMTLLGQTAGGLGDPNRMVGLLGVSVLLGYATWALARWFLSSPTKPDPWDEQVSAELADGECEPLCHRCLSSHAPLANFCPKCGAAVGTYTNWLPFPYLFSIGHTLRIGTSESFNRSPLTIIGFFLLSIAEYTLLAPVYWIALIRNLRRFDRPGEPNSSGPPSDKSPVGD